MEAKLAESDDRHGLVALLARASGCLPEGCGFKLRRCRWPAAGGLANGVLASTAPGLAVEILTHWTQVPRGPIFLSYRGNDGTISLDVRLPHIPKSVRIIRPSRSANPCSRSCTWRSEQGPEGQCQTAIGKSSEMLFIRFGTRRMDVGKAPAQLLSWPAAAMR